MSHGDESSSWWGKNSSFKDDQVQTYVTPRRTKHGALYDRPESIIDLSRWDDETYVYDLPSYRHGSSRSDDSSYDRAHDAYASVDRDATRSYSNDRFAYNDEVRNSQSHDYYNYGHYDTYNQRRSDFGYSSDRYYDEPYRSSDRYGYGGYSSYDDFERVYGYGAQPQMGNDESSSWWGNTYVVNDDRVQTYVKPRQYGGDYGYGAQAVTEADSWWSKGNVYNEDQVQTYTRQSNSRDPMRHMHHDQPQYFY